MVWGLEDKQWRRGLKAVGESSSTASIGKRKGMVVVLRNKKWKS